MSFCGTTERGSSGRKKTEHQVSSIRSEKENRRSIGLYSEGEGVGGGSQGPVITSPHHLEKCEEDLAL
ncbi:unnamed protein product [Rhodiola kirilowii]